jgi:IS30 family transposase
MARGRPGPAPQTAKREQFARLIARGISNAEACRIVGVNPRDRETLAARADNHQQQRPAVALSTCARCAGAGDLGAVSVRGRARRDRGSASVRPDGAGDRGRAGPEPGDGQPGAAPQPDPQRGQYRPFTAQRLAAAGPGRGKLLRDLVLRQFVAGRLETRWSPEQISHALRCEFPGVPERHVVHETIYQAVYRAELGRPRRRADARRARSLAGMTMIDQRPAEAGSRAVPGHWEGDLITGAANRPGDRHPGRAVQPVHHLAAPARRAEPGRAPGVPAGQQRHREGRRGRRSRRGRARGT